MGQSPTEFVAKTRLYYAAELLRTSGAPIKSVAVSVGFSSRSHFSHAFRAAYGIDPTAYRQGQSRRSSDAGAAGSEAHRLAGPAGVLAHQGPLARLIGPFRAIPAPDGGKRRAA